MTHEPCFDESLGLQTRGFGKSADNDQHVLLPGHERRHLRGLCGAGLHRGQCGSQSRRTDPDDFVCHRQRAGRHGCQVRFGFGVADDSLQAAPAGAGQASQNFLRIMADNIERQNFSAQAGAAQDLHQVGAGIGVVARPQRGLFQRNSLHDDAAVDGNASGAGESGRHDGESRTALGLGGRISQ